MIKSIFILLVVGMCSEQSWFVSGHNCTEPSAYNTNECVFECIQILYDTEYCTGCDAGDKVTKINLNPNQTLTSLVQHDLIFYNFSTQSLGAGNCSGCSANQTEQSFIERYKQPTVLTKYVNCTANSTATLDGVTKTNCTTNEVRELYENIMKRLEKEKWCVGALQLGGQYLKQLIVQPLDNSRNEMSNKDAMGNGAESSATEQIASSTEASITTEVIPLPENMEEFKKPSAAEATSETDDSPTTENSETTSPLIIPTTTMKPTSTTTADTTTHTTISAPESTTKSAKSKPTKKKKIVEEHHYMGSLTIIAIIVGLLLTVLIILAVVVRVLISRRQRMHPRSSSTTYVFESHQY
ncbi:uncharacterized protein LOC129567321 [Sitodiplosis mosellana]|uniref:uncharacterized protein LOC129567321 n=1 Tax=Sitodiplosis mosellana TaxID=263140 RepID=UPI00244509F1|nr:uncharacterized protein LOC129567321 [Sitodiplosis mosellana]